MSRKTELQFRCEGCWLICVSGDWLLAPSPFDAEELITGCKRCSSINSFVLLCDEDGCEKIAGCGWQSGDVYRHTCAKHYGFDKK